MKAINVCPSTLTPGYAGYSPRAVKMLFDGVAVSPILDIDFEKERDQQQARDNMNNMSISGAQEKFSAVLDDGHIRLSREGEQVQNLSLKAYMSWNLKLVSTCSRGKGMGAG